MTNNVLRVQLAATIAAGVVTCREFLGASVDVTAKISLEFADAILAQDVADGLARKAHEATLWNPHAVAQRFQAVQDAENVPVHTLGFEPEPNPLTMFTPVVLKPNIPDTHPLDKKDPIT